MSAAKGPVVHGAFQFTAADFAAGFKIVVSLVALASLSGAYAVAGAVVTLTSVVFRLHTSQSVLSIRMISSIFS